MIISETQGPFPLPFYAQGAERGLDPWHRDAFPDVYKDSAPSQQPVRKHGWFLLDWCGNCVGWVADGELWPEKLPAGAESGSEATSIVAVIAGEE